MSKLPRDNKGRFLGGIPQKTNKNGTAGRPSVYTDDVKDKILYALSTGKSVKQATKYAGVSIRSFYDFLKRNPDFKTQVEKYTNELNQL